MGDKKHLQDQAAIDKLCELVKENDIAMLCTRLTEAPFSTCPMTTQKVEKESGVIWFFSDNNGHHHQDIRADRRVQLLYAKTGSNSFLSIYGWAEVVHDRDKIDELWSPMAKVWFQGGKDDPRLTLLRVLPEEGYYWDTKNGKMVSFLKMISSLATGKTRDGGIQGKLRMGE